MATGPNQLGEGVINIRANLDPLKADLAVAQKMVEDANLTPGSVAPGAAPGTPGSTPAPIPAPGTPGKGPVVVPDPAETDKGREAVDKADRSVDKFVQTTRGAGEPMRGFTQSIRNQVNALLGLTAVATAVGAALYSAVMAGKRFGDQSLNDQLNIKLLDDQIRKSTDSIEKFNAARDKTISNRFGQNPTGMNNIQYASAELGAARVEQQEKNRSLREFEENPFRNLAWAWDLGVTSVGLGGLQTGQGAEFDKRKFEADQVNIRERNLAKMVEGIANRLYGDRAGQSSMGEVNVKLAESVEIQGEMLKTQKFQEATRPR